MDMAWGKDLRGNLNLITHCNCQFSHSVLAVVAGTERETDQLMGPQTVISILLVMA